MSSREKKPVADTDPLPFRTALHRPGGSPDDRDDRVLAGALLGLYPEPGRDQGDEALNNDEGWAALEDAALRLAHKRRRRYHMWELFRSFGQARFVVYAAFAMLPILVAFFLWPAARPARLLALSHPVSGLKVPGLSGLVDQRAPHVILQSPDAGDGTMGAKILCGAQLHLSRGQAHIEQGDPNRPLITLHNGVLGVQVPTLHAGGKLVVATADAEVIVHGTKFQVDKQKEDLTSVSVQEGLVEVRPRGGHRQPVFLRAGERLSVPSPGAYLVLVQKQVDEMIATRSCEDPIGALDAFLDRSPKDLDKTAALYLKGSCAAERGERETALSCFERVAASTASPTRADNALARIAQIRAAGSQSDGMAAWRRYLEHFPRGLHRESALHFLQDPAVGQRERLTEQLDSSSQTLPDSPGLPRLPNLPNPDER